MGLVFKKHNSANRAAKLCTAIDHLSDVLRSEEVEFDMDEFDQVHSHNPEYMLMSAYMSVVEILQNFIRSERDGNCILHLEAFTAMLLWLTIYEHKKYA